MTTANLPLVTIGIPTFNGASKFLGATLSSACVQDYDNLEILVSDNASTDATPRLVQDWGDRRIRYHRHPENIGPDPNFNYCIGAARGEYFLLLMDDDMIDPDFVVTCIAAAASDPDAAMIRTGTRVIDATGTVLYESPNATHGLGFSQFVLAWFAGRTAPFLCSTLFKTGPLATLGHHSKYGLWADVVTELQLAAQYRRIDIPEVKATFRMHPGQHTFAVPLEYWCEESLDLLDLIVRLAPEDAAILRARGRRFLSMFNYRLAVAHPGSWLTRLARCRTVYRIMETAPDVLALARERLRQTRGGAAIRRWKRAFAGTATTW